MTKLICSKWTERDVVLYPNEIVKDLPGLLCERTSSQQRRAMKNFREAFESMRKLDVEDVEKVQQGWKTFFGSAIGKILLAKLQSICPKFADFRVQSLLPRIILDTFSFRPLNVRGTCHICGKDNEMLSIIINTQTGFCQKCKGELDLIRNAINKIHNFVLDFNGDRDFDDLSALYRQISYRPLRSIGLDENNSADGESLDLDESENDEGLPRRQVHWFTEEELDDIQYEEARGAAWSHDQKALAILTNTVCKPDVEIQELQIAWSMFLVTPLGEEISEIIFSQVPKSISSEAEYFDNFFYSPSTHLAPFANPTEEGCDFCDSPASTHIVVDDGGGGLFCEVCGVYAEHIRNCFCKIYNLALFYCSEKSFMKVLRQLRAPVVEIVEEEVEQMEEDEQVTSLVDPTDFIPACGEIARDGAQAFIDGGIYYQRFYDAILPYLKQCGYQGSSNVCLDRVTEFFHQSLLGPIAYRGLSEGPRSEHCWVCDRKATCDTQWNGHFVGTKCFGVLFGLRKYANLIREICEKYDELTEEDLGSYLTKRDRIIYELGQANDNKRYGTEEGENDEAETILSPEVPVEVQVGAKITGSRIVRSRILGRICVFNVFSVTNDDGQEYPEVFLRSEIRNNDGPQILPDIRIGAGPKLRKYLFDHNFIDSSRYTASFIRCQDLPSPWKVVTNYLEQVGEQDLFSTALGTRVKHRFYDLVNDDYVLYHNMAIVQNLSASVLERSRNFIQMGPKLLTLAKFCEIVEPGAETVYMLVKEDLLQLGWVDEKPIPRSTLTPTAAIVISKKNSRHVRLQLYDLTDDDGKTYTSMFNKADLRELSNMNSIDCLGIYPGPALQALAIDAKLCTANSVLEFCPVSVFPFGGWFVNEILTNLSVDVDLSSLGPGDIIPSKRIVISRPIADIQVTIQTYSGYNDDGKKFVNYIFGNSFKRNKLFLSRYQHDQMIRAGTKLVVNVRKLDCFTNDRISTRLLDPVYLPSTWTIELAPDNEAPVTRKRSRPQVVIDLLDSDEEEDKDEEEVEVEEEVEEPSHIEEETTSVPTLRDEVLYEIEEEKSRLTTKRQKLDADLRPKHPNWDCPELHEVFKAEISLALERGRTSIFVTYQILEGTLSFIDEIEPGARCNVVPLKYLKEFTQTLNKKWRNKRKPSCRLVMLNYFSRAVEDFWASLQNASLYRDFKFSFFPNSVQFCKIEWSK